MAEPKKAQEPKAAGEKPPEVAAGADVDHLEEMKKYKPKKKAALPTEMLTDAKSYDDKLVLVKMLTEKERNRMVLIIKNLLK
ncbi:MAG: hypothetical protein LW714_00115 [Oxalobacteraceae bacterium]|jgi:hypothetical protein|nr:hypothetical protein [Oxalobacteraceae bacterium]